MMNERFTSLVESLEPGFRQLVAMDPVRYSDLPARLPRQAVYLFSEGDEHLYVGRTNNLRNRLLGHCAPGAGRYSAVFAFRLARETTGLLNATYRPEEPRVELTEDPVFDAVFAAARIRVSQMELRFVEVTDAVRQALLVIYVATALDTRYNDFNLARDR
jgi:hypothetical protein